MVIHFKKLKKKDLGSKLKMIQIIMIGYIKNRKFPSKHKNTHKICSVFQHHFIQRRQTNIKLKISLVLDLK